MILHDGGSDGGVYNVNMLSVDSLQVKRTNVRTVLIYRTGEILISGVQRVSHVVPGGFALQQNYSNPFNPTTNFGFWIADCSATGGSASGGGFVSIKVYDVPGREVATLVNEVKQPGEYTVAWDATGEPGGIYFYKLTAGMYTDCKKMVLIK